MIAGFWCSYFSTYTNFGKWAGIAPRPSLSTGKHHPLVAIQASNIDLFCRLNGIPAAGANIFPCAGGTRRRGGSCAAVCPCPGDLEPGKLVSVYENVGQAVLQYEVQQLVRGACVAPSVFVAMLHDQAVGFGGGFEAPVMVGVAPAAILYAVLEVVVVNHFVKQGRRHFLDGTGQRPGPDIDFMGAAQLGNPGIFPQGEVAVGAGRGLYGDRRP